MKYFVFLWLITFIICYLFVGCNKKQIEFDQKQFIVALKVCLDDPNLKRNMELDINHRSINQWILNGNFKIDNSFIIDKRKYIFKASNLFIHSDSTILYKLSYPDKNISHISLKYIPSKTYGIKGEFDFKYEDGTWKIIKREAGIEDYKFVE